MMLVFVMIIEYRDRGIVFGWPSQYDSGSCSVKCRLTYISMYLVRRYHGYTISFASVYVTWYHPMENTWGHVVGFTQTYLILHQGALAYTTVHLNKCVSSTRTLF